MTGLVDACLNHRLLNLVLVPCVHASDARAMLMCAPPRTLRVRARAGARGRVRASEQQLTTCSSLMSEEAGLLQKSNTSLV